MQTAGVEPSSVYYRTVDVCPVDLGLMKAIDAIHLDQLFRGNRRMRDKLTNRMVLLRLLTAKKSSA
ncbi:MAG: hypothetical protein M8364_06845 [Methylobacter sp.]|jgi:hypothetical protein|uniref:hypothetical protein n=1 Tax=Methylobacter sp. TaxID=2051955 RepID=UPI0025895EC4|nr:hypothetical protein [Methylobacter sp.]MCL7420603.1 hypothetical protein [Methylobacter sp.]